MKYNTCLAPVVKKEYLGQGLYDFTLSVDKELSDISFPGQFVHIYSEGKTLRRPISICDVDKTNYTLRIIFQVRGDGTDILSKKNVGDKMDVLMPLGKGFNVSDKTKKAIVIGGGIGVPPLLYTAKQFSNCIAILGFRNKELVILEDEFNHICNNTVVTTDDGSYGIHGVVTSPLEEELKKGDTDIIYSCGPTPMLKAIASVAKKYNVKCEVSLEERMACGVGACLGCAVKTTRADAMGGYSHVCKDGPVFDSEEVVW